MISREEITRGMNCPPELESNLERLLESLNKFRAAYGKPMVVTSGLRSWIHNQQVGGKPGSAHLTAEAADVLDLDRSLASFCLGRPELLEECGLWMEDPAYTIGKSGPWVHLQIRPASRRVFLP